MNSSEYLPTIYQQFIYKSRYSRWLEEQGRREYWPETVARYFNFFEEHLQDKYGYKIPTDQRIWLESMVLNLKAMPSMRALMTAGPALKRENMAGFNCSYLPIDDPRAFDEVLYILMNGTGVGFSVEQRYIQKLPPVPDALHKSETIIAVADSKIGWASGLRELIALLYAGKIPNWDLSKVRAAGSRLKTFGGRASGPEPLDTLYRFVVDVFQKAVGRRLTTLEVHDIVCKVAEIVVVGGVRRAALDSLGDLNDDLMRRAKVGQWWIDDPQRALANNSWVAVERPTMASFFPEWYSLYESKAGERGIFNRYGAVKHISKHNRRDTDHIFGTNPCVTGDTLLLTSIGNIPIKEVWGKWVSIWNGFTWSKVMPFSTGVNDLHRVHLSNGVKIDCTIYHKFILDGYVKVEARDLKAGSKLQSFSIYDTDIYVNGVEDLIREEETFCVTEPICGNMTVNGIVTGNCFEILLRPMQTCNLSEAVLRHGDTKEEIKEKLTAAAIFGTWQSTLDNFRFIRKKWSDNQQEERLLGVSLTGVYDWGINNATYLDEIKDLVIAVNNKEAQKLGVNPSTATTCIKPSGTVSQLTDASSGLHPRHSPYYVRTVRGDKKDPLTQFLIDRGVPCENDLMAPQSTVVFSFPIKSPEGSVCRKDLTAIDQLEVYKKFQDEYCEHKPSITINVKEHEWLDVGAWVYKNIDDVIGVSFLPDTEHSYKQAPYQDCSREEYKELQSKMPKEINWDELQNYEKEDNTVGSQEYACSSGFCEII